MCEANIVFAQRRLSPARTGSISYFFFLLRARLNEIGGGAARGTFRGVGSYFSNRVNPSYTSRLATI